MFSKNNLNIKKNKYKKSLRIVCNSFEKYLSGNIFQEKFKNLKKYNLFEYKIQ